MCGGSMRLRHTTSTVRIPGNPVPTPRRDIEWVCPDCDYFEEAEENPG